MTSGIHGSLAAVGGCDGRVSRAPSASVEAAGRAARAPRIKTRTEASPVPAVASVVDAWRRTLFEASDAYRVHVCEM